MSCFINIYQKWLNFYRKLFIDEEYLPKYTEIESLPEYTIVSSLELNLPEY